MLSLQYDYLVWLKFSFNFNLLIHVLTLVFMLHNTTGLATPFRPLRGVRWQVLCLPRQQSCGLVDMAVVLPGRSLQQVNIGLDIVDCTYDTMLLAFTCVIHLWLIYFINLLYPTSVFVFVRIALFKAHNIGLTFTKLNHFIFSMTYYYPE